jgi:hypothetical protein
MSVTRKTISLPDDANELLQNLATDCGMDASHCITQLLRRHSGDIRNLFAIDVSKRMQSYAPVPTIVASVPTEVVATKGEPIAAEIVPLSPEATIEPISESPADELARLVALPKFEKFKNMNRITELKELLEA